MSRLGKMLLERQGSARSTPYATSRKLILSADLAWLLCLAHRACAPDLRDECTYLRMPHFGYDGRQALKGISSGEPYPLVWIRADTGSVLETAEDTMLSRKRPDGQHAPEAEVNNLWSFCEGYLSGLNPLRMKPYIPGDPKIGIAPQEHQERFAKLEEYVNGPPTQLSMVSSDEAGSTRAEIPDAAKRFAYLVINS